MRLRRLPPCVICGLMIAVASNKLIMGSVLQHTSLRGGSVSLRCAVDRQDPDVVVYWNRGNASAAPFISVGSKVLIDRYQLKVDDSGASLSDYYTVTIGNFSDKDEGEYMCAAQSGKTGQMFAQLFNIQLIEAPEVQVEQRLGLDERHTLRVRTHSDAQLTCSGVGRPLPDVRWRRGKLAGAVLPLPSASASASESESESAEKSPFWQLQVEQNVSVLKLRRVNTTLNGSNFECVASNAAGTATYGVEIFVEVPPKLKSATANSVHTALGNTESLRCAFEANPAPEIKWQYWSDKDGGFVPVPLVMQLRKYNTGAKNRIPFTHEYSLCIFNMRFEDARRYRCVATSNLSDDAVTKVFNVTFAPSEPVVRVDSEFVFANACNISWYTISTNTTHYNLEIRPVYNYNNYANYANYNSSTPTSWETIELKHESIRVTHHDGEQQKPKTGSGKSVRQQHTVKNYTGTHIISRLTPNTTYEVRLTACNMQFCSRSSNVVTFLTPDESHAAPSWFVNLKRRAQAAEVSMQAMKTNAASSWGHLLTYLVGVCALIPYSCTNSKSQFRRSSSFM